MRQLHPVASVPTPNRIFAPWLPFVFAVALTFVFWLPLWFGAGFVGGDLYPYYFPQKQYLADNLRQGTFPLWNLLTGNGYPVLGESQTGACYPLHLVAYALADVQTAWNAVHLIHYITAFIAAWLFARRSGLATCGALLAATVYVYGWFPARAALEWAILGGVYLPLALCCVEGCLQTQRARWLIGLGVALGLQLLGGHYQIAFYTWLVLAMYVPARVWFVPRLSPPRVAGGREVFTIHSERATPGDSPGAKTRRPRIDALFLSAAILGGIALGGIQLLPTWELKQRSQRTDAGVEHDPNYGHIPPTYLTQLVQPWSWYDPQRDLDGELHGLKWHALQSGTNRVEAHLYVGQAAFYLAVGSCLWMLICRRLDRWAALWLIIGLLATLAAVGAFQPLIATWPGFGYFRGVGRIGIVTTLAFALLAGRAFDRLLVVTPHPWKRLLAVGILAGTVIDLAWWPARINYAVIVEHPPIRARNDSPLRKLLRAESHPVRLYAPGANMANLLGVASTPVYLGLGPREYFDPQFAMPRAENDDFHAFTPERQEWLRHAGVTHILSFEPLESRGWSVERVWTGFDPLLNPAWARFHEPLYLYRLNDALGRVYGEASSITDRAENRETASEQRSQFRDSLQAIDVQPHRVTVEVSAPVAGRLILTDLAYPGWQVALDGQPVANGTAGMFRAVDVPVGHHILVWSYRPAFVYWGALVSALGAVWLVCVARFARFTSRNARP